MRDEHGYAGSLTTVTYYVREQKRRTKEVFVPLSHRPGHAHVDFGENLSVIGGVECKIHFYVMSLQHSDGVFVKGYPAETTEAFCEDHVSAFAFFGGIHQSILYDKTKIAVARILGDRTRVRTRRFTELQSHYLFDDKFGRPARGNDKGNVEGMVGYTSRNFMVPAPRYDRFDDLNAHLEQRCLERPNTFKLRQPATWAHDLCILPAEQQILTKEKHMFKGLFLSLGIIVLGGIIGLPALLALAV